MNDRNHRSKCKLHFSFLIVITYTLNYVMSIVKNRVNFF